MQGIFPTSIGSSSTVVIVPILIYEYTIKFRGTQLHGNADALSRLPRSEELPPNEEPPELVLLMEHLADSPVTARQIQSWTRRDPF